MTYDNILQATNYIQTKCSLTPRVGIILGSGLNALADMIEMPTIIPYQEIPFFPISTVKGHEGNLIIGRLADKLVLCMQGRVHYYEGYTMEEVTFPVKVMALLGIKKLIVTNAAGGVREDFNCGDLMLIEDHINRMPNPLIGRNEERLGTRFPSMNNCYDNSLRLLAQNCAKHLNIPLQSGVYVANEGPSFETSAEYKLFRHLGISAVGMSTVPEVIVASWCGIKVLAFSVISNVFDDNPLKSETHQEVLDNVSKASNNLVMLIEEIMKKI